MAKTTDSGLTDKQERFCQEYCVDFNATQAAIRAGYSEKTADVIGIQNLGKLKVDERIAKLKASLEKRTQKTQADIIAELEYIGFSRITDVLKVNGSGINLIDSDKWTDPQSAAVESIAQTKDGLRLKMYSKLDALKTLAQMHGMLEHKEQETDELPSTVKIITTEQ